MSIPYRSFDEFWSAFVLEQGRGRRRRWGGTSLVLARLALGALGAHVSALAAARLGRRHAHPLLEAERPASEPLRWALAAQLMSWSKRLSGTLEAEVIQTSGEESWPWPAELAIAALEATTSDAPVAMPAAPATPTGGDWAVWM